MKVMVTGVNGILGKEIVNLLSKNKSYQLVLLSNSKINVKSKKNIKLIKQDLTKSLIFKLNIDSIIHCAAKNPLSKSGSDMKTIYNDNLKITKNLIKFSNKNRVKKIIFLSSMDVYGVVKKKIVTENLTPQQPNLYGKSKFLSEKLFNKKNNKFQTISLRIPGIFSINLSRNKPLIINILKKILKNENIYVYNHNNSFNNIIDVQEIVKFLNIILKKKRVRTSIYNFAASNPLKFIDVIKLIKRFFKSNSKILTKNQDKNSFTISNKKIKKDFNIKLSTTKNIIIRCCRKILNTNYKTA